jgi:acyl carrier protein
MSPDTPTDDPRTASEAAVRAAVLEIAPDLPPDTLDETRDLHEDLGLDSIDLLNIAGAIAERTGFEVPERAVPTLRTLGDLIDLVHSRGESAA